MNIEMLKHLAAKHSFSVVILEKDYMLTKLLEKISKSSMEKNLALKGGTALNKLYFGYYRLSEDLDFNIANKNISEIIEELRDLVKEMNLKISNEIISMRNWNANIEFEGACKNNIKIDISYTEKPILPLVKNPVKHFYPDIDKFSFQTFQLKEITSEKIRTLITRKEPRDYFDIWYILERDPKILENIMPLVEKKCKFMNAEADIGKVFENLDTLEKLWSYRLENVAPNLPKFEAVISELKKRLRGKI